jgi:hypothetical protein
MRTLPRPVRFLVAVAVLDLLALIIVVVICWLGGWQRRVDYAHGLVYAGMALPAGAGLRYVGGASEAQPGDSVMHSLHAVDIRGQRDRLQRSIADSVRVAPLPLLLLAAGAVTIAVGLLLQ